MNLKAISLGAVIGFLVAVVPSCGTTSNCSPANCGGCCDKNGSCVTVANTSDSLCGKLGVACVDCKASLQACNADTKLCEAQTASGGGAGNTGGGAGNTGGGSNNTGGGTGSMGGGSGGGSMVVDGCNVELQNCTALGAPGKSCLEVMGTGTATRCMEGQCDMVLQNCPTNTDKCDYSPLPDGGALRSCFRAGTKTEGQTCTGGADCVAGMLCIGTCVKMCYRDEDCSGPNDQCVIRITGIPGESPRGCKTLTPCDPLAPAQPGCPAGEACYPSPNGTTVCRAAGTGVVNSACTSVNACAEGSFCLPKSQTEASCSTYCNPDGGAPGCTTPATCNSPGDVTFSFCL